MTSNKKGRAPAKDATPKTNNGVNYTASVLRTAASGWRGALAAGIPKFRIHGTYDAPAGTRTMRRYLAKEARKAMALLGVQP